jgi:hypothetical protein
VCHKIAAKRSTHYKLTFQLPVKDAEGIW